MCATNPTANPFPSGANGFMAETADPRHLRQARLREAHLREALGRFATGVTVVAAGARGGELAGLTANAVTSISLDPPLPLVCVKALKQRFEAYLAARAEAAGSEAGAREVPLGAGISLVCDMFVAETMAEAERLAGEGILTYLRLGLPLARPEGNDRDGFLAALAPSPARPWP